MGVGALKRLRVAFPLVASGIAMIIAVGTAHAFTEAQVHAGTRTFKRQCARCHGVDGSGKDNQFKGLRAPELIGKGALPCRPRPFQKIRKSNFRTAKDVYDYASASMPADQPAILDAEEYWDVVAYLLQANGRTVDAMPLDATSAAHIVLHPDCPATGGP